jgi:hypothetical protein
MFIKKIITGLSLGLASAVASAAIWSQTIDFIPGLNVPNKATWTHDLGTDDFNFGIHTITSFSLSVRIVDRGNAFDRLLDLETAVVDLEGGTSADDIWFFAIGRNDYKGDLVGGTAELNRSGLLTVSVDTARLLGAAIGGNFSIAESTLTAEGVVTEPDALPLAAVGVVPEPGALPLVAVALLGLGLSRRRQARPA